VAVLDAHDMFLKLRSFFLEPNTPVTIALYNGTFEQSENVITRDRMIDVSVIGPGSERTQIDTTHWRDGWYETLLDLKPGDPGTYVLGVSTKARIIELAAKDFNEYLAHDGVMNVLEARKKNNELGKDARELYSKHVKTIFQVGEKRSESYKTKLGYPIEIVPLQNPYSLAEGDVLEVLILRDGKPVANQLVYASYAGHHEHVEAQEEDAEEHDDAAAHGEAVKTGTDASGVAKIKLEAGGHWYIRLINMVESDKENVDYESSWATLTFEVK
jgi:hypothetical protein